MPNEPHLHLLVNHIPLMGAFFAALLLAVALLRRRDRGVLLAAVAVLGIGGAGALAAYWTGEPAMDAVEEVSPADEADIGLHEDRAEIATWAAVVTALAGGAVLWFASRRAPGDALATALVGVLLLCAVVTAGLMARAGNAGGEIMHREVRPGWKSPAQRAAEKRSGHEGHEHGGEGK